MFLDYNKTSFKWNKSIIISTPAQSATDEQTEEKGEGKGRLKLWFCHRAQWYRTGELCFRYPTSSRLGSPTENTDTWRSWKNHLHFPAPKHPRSTVTPRGAQGGHWMEHYNTSKGAGKAPFLPTKIREKVSTHQYWSLQQGQLELGWHNALGNPNPGKPNPRRRVCYCLWGITNTVKDNENIKFKETACFPIHMKIIPVPLVMHLGSFVKTSTKMSSKPRKPPAFLW